jgi:hypothetical protein
VPRSPLTPAKLLHWRLHHRYVGAPITQARMARLLVVGQRTYRRWERGETRIPPWVAEFLGYAHRVSPGITAARRPRRHPKARV